MPKMSGKDYQILDYIIEQTKTNGFPPTVREIGKAVNLSSTSSVQNRLNKIKECGFLEKGDSKNRTLRVINYGEPEEKETEYVDVPLYGKVAAGIPISAVQGWDTLAIPRDFVKNKDLFVLKVNGESMIKVGIFDGDYIIVNHQESVENGEIAVALVSGNEEATVKTFYKENGHFRLQPENDTMEPIIVDEVTIIGKVIGVYRNLI